MFRSNLDLLSIIIAIIEFDINYFVYAKTGSFLYVLTIILGSAILIVGFILSDIYSKFKTLEDNYDEIDQRLIRHGELEDIRLDLREIKKEVFKRK